MAARVAGLLIIMSIGGSKSIHLSSKLGRSPHNKDMGLLMGWTVPMHLHLRQRQGARREVMRGCHQVTSRLSRGIIRCKPRPCVKASGMAELMVYGERALWKWSSGEHQKSLGADTWVQLFNDSTVSSYECMQSLRGPVLFSYFFGFEFCLS